MSPGYVDAMADDQKRVRKKPCYCQNCGKPGHVSRDCLLPVTSYGIIMFDRDDHFVLSGAPPGNQSITVDQAPPSQLLSVECKPTANTLNLPPEHNECNLYTEPRGENEVELIAVQPIKYLLVRRRDSMSYVEFLRGKYHLQDVRFIYQMLSEMTRSERERVSRKSFDKMWRGLWSNSFVNSASVEYKTAAFKFHQLQHGYPLLDGSVVTLHKALRATSCQYFSPEWGFPKGKRNKREKDIHCAQREFAEETGCRFDNSYNIIRELGSVEELFFGSNQVEYKHIYFVS